MIRFEHVSRAPQITKCARKRLLTGLATAAAVLQMNGSAAQSARIVMGAVATVPWVSEEAALAIANKAIDERMRPRPARLRSAGLGL